MPVVVRAFFALPTGVVDARDAAMWTSLEASGGWRPSGIVESDADIARFRCLFRSRDDDDDCPTGAVEAETRGGTEGSSFSCTCDAGGGFSTRPPGTGLPWLS
jgi:hypothetical protein